MNNKKHYFSKFALSLFCLFSIGLLQANARIKIGELYYTVDSVKMTARVGHNADTAMIGKIVIPPSVIYRGKTYAVTSIGQSSFFNCKSMTAVSIPNSIQMIGSNAFYGCSAMDSISIPSSVTTIGNYACLSCSALSYISIPASVTTIGASAFSDTPWYKAMPDGLIYINHVAYAYKGKMPEGTSITLKEGTVSISPHAFWGCTGLTSITIPASVTFPIGFSTFNGCTGLTSVSMPNTIPSIEGYAFYHCSSLPSITIPNSVTSIGEYAFSGCTSLSKVSIPSSVTFISTAALENTPWMAAQPEGIVYINNVVYYYKGFEISDTVSLRQGTVSISPYAFSGHSKLKCMKMPNTVTTIGSYAFYGCSSLSSVTLSSGIKSLGESLFWGCQALKNIHSNIMEPGEVLLSPDRSKWDTDYDEPNSVSEQEFTFNGVDKKLCLLYVPFNAKAKYLQCEQWKDFSVVIEMPDGIQPVWKDAQSDGKYYDLNGRLVIHPAKGIYIHSGRKVMMK